MNKKMILEKVTELSDAVKYFKKALESCPTNQTIRDHLDVDRSECQNKLDEMVDEMVGASKNK